MSNCISHLGKGQKSVTVDFEEEVDRLSTLPTALFMSIVEYLNPPEYIEGRCISKSWHQKSCSIVLLQKQSATCNKLIHHLTKTSLLSEKFLNIELTQASIQDIFKDVSEPMENRFKWWVGIEWLSQSNSYLFSDAQHQDHGAILLSFPTWDSCVQAILCASFTKYGNELRQEIYNNPSIKLLSHIAKQISSNLEGSKMLLEGSKKRPLLY